MPSTVLTRFYLSGNKKPIKQSKILSIFSYSSREIHVNSLFFLVESHESGFSSSQRIDCVRLVN